MRVLNKQGLSNWRSLDRVLTGTAVRFRRPFHQTNCPTGAVFIVCKTSDCYRPEECRYENKIPVVNLENGRMSYVCGDRDVEMLRSEVIVTGVF